MGGDIFPSLPTGCRIKIEIETEGNIPNIKVYLISGVKPFESSTGKFHYS
jgi:hypothetical protein